MEADKYRSTLFAAIPIAETNTLKTPSVRPLIMLQREVPNASSQALIFCVVSAEIYPMRICQLITPYALICSLAILTGCHLSLIPSPAPSMAAVAVLAGGLLGIHLLIAFGREITQTRRG
jgi:hypothetical protein